MPTPQAAPGAEVTTPLGDLPAWVYQGRVPCLDGLRALAIASVIDSHLHDRRNVGHMGVTLFFVISGFLITLLMLREQNRTGTVGLRDFYRRRTLRIVPAMAFYLLCIGALQAFGITRILASYWIYAVTYTMCYADFNHISAGHGWEIGHTWSLSVEEHFYLLWPLLFVFLKPAKAFRVLLVYLLTVPVLHYLINHTFGGRFASDFVSITEMGSIGMGCVAAYFAHGSVFARLYAKTNQFPHVLLAGGTALVIAQMFFGSTKAQTVLLHKGEFISKTFGDPLSALGFAMILLWAVHISPTTLVSRVLNARPLVYVGTLSYSLYLWQEPFLGEGIFAHRPGLWGHNAITFILIAVCALVSYCLVEVPFLRIKNRPKKTSPVPTAAAAAS